MTGGSIARCVRIFVKHRKDMPDCEHYDFNRVCVAPDGESQL